MHYIIMILIKGEIWKPTAIHTTTQNRKFNHSARKKGLVCKYKAGLDRSSEEHFLFQDVNDLHIGKTIAEYRTNTLVTECNLLTKLLHGSPF